jgi:hypothetical protein
MSDGRTTTSGEGRAGEHGTDRRDVIPIDDDHDDSQDAITALPLPVDAWPDQLRLMYSRYKEEAKQAMRDFRRNFNCCKEAAEKLQQKLGCVVSALTLLGHKQPAISKRIAQWRQSEGSPSKSEIVDGLGL